MLCTRFACLANVDAWWQDIEYCTWICVDAPIFASRAEAVCWGSGRGARAGSFRRVCARTRRLESLQVFWPTAHNGNMVAAVNGKVLVFNYMHLV